MDTPTVTPARSGRGKAEQGFTLLEALIAVAILAVSLTSLLASQLESMAATRYARQLSAAAFLAEYQLVEIEWQQREDGWQTNDITFEGDFDQQGWPDIEYECFVDYIELPEYNQMVQAKEAVDADTDGDAQLTQDGGDQAFGALGIVWPLVKAAIENSIRRASCKVMWRNGNVDEEFDVVTFWTKPEALAELPTLGGEFNTGTDDQSTDGPSGNTGGSTGGLPPRPDNGVGTGGVAPGGGP